MAALPVIIEIQKWWTDAFHWRNGKMDQLEGWGLYNVNTGQASSQIGWNKLFLSATEMKFGEV